MSQVYGYELGLWFMSQFQDLGFSVMCYGQGYELGLWFMSQFQYLGFMSQVQGLWVRVRVMSQGQGQGYELGLGVMGQCYELRLGL